MKNYGLDLVKEEREESREDYIFGSTTSLMIRGINNTPLKDRKKFLPEGEVQMGAEDTSSCASNAPVNIIETEFNYLIDQDLINDENFKWLNSNGYYTERGFEFSDAFIAIKSGTTRDGNSLKAPLHAIHKYGLVPKSLMPLDDDMTWEDYHNPERITPKIEALAEEFERRFTINYERVYERNFEEVLDKDMLIVAAHAWPRPTKDYYPRTNARLNHAFMLFDLPAYYAFDSYIDNIDGDFIKKLANNYIFFKYGYRIIINQKMVVIVDKLPFWKRITKGFKGILQFV